MWCIGASEYLLQWQKARQVTRTTGKMPLSMPRNRAKGATVARTEGRGFLRNMAAEGVGPAPFGICCVMSPRTV